MDEIDPMAALIARNWQLLAQAVEARLRAEAAAAKAEQAVQRAMVAQRWLQSVVPPATLRLPHDVPQHPGRD